MFPANLVVRARRGGADALLVGLLLCIGLSLHEAPAARAQWIPHTPLTPPSPRRGHAMAYDSARDVTVLFGGETLAGLSNETWEWNGVNWIQRIVSLSPGPRGAHAMAYDSARGVTVLFGGATPTGPSDETWEWNGASWTDVSSPGPAARSSHALAYDSARDVTVLFGGYVGVFPWGSPSDETWEWNGITWTRRDDLLPPPPARWGHAMAYDAATATVILFGGHDDVVYYDDTWELLDAFGWVLLPTPTHPSARKWHAMVYACRVIVLFGGKTPAVYSDETWEWNGASWTDVSSPGPSGRLMHGMAYDRARGQTVLFGGDDGSRLGDTWEFHGVCCADLDGDGWVHLGDLGILLLEGNRGLRQLANMTRRGQ